jgi:hypothetical protein
VIEKYQTATCQQLWQEKAQKQGQPKPEMEQRAIQMLAAGSADASGFLQQVGSAHRQQDVRMRDDSMKLVTNHFIRQTGIAMVLSLLVVTGAGAQTAPSGAKPAKPAARKQAAPVDKPALEARAVDLLKATSARLAAAKAMSFTATVSYEHPSRLGPPLVFTSRYDVVMQRPKGSGSSTWATARPPSSISMARPWWPSRRPRTSSPSPRRHRPSKRR